MCPSPEALFECGVLDVKFGAFQSVGIAAELIVSEAFPSFNKMQANLSLSDWSCPCRVLWVSVFDSLADVCCLSKTPSEMV